MPKIRSSVVQYFHRQLGNFTIKELSKETSTALAEYLLHWGIWHLLVLKRKKEAQYLLLNLDLLEKMLSNRVDWINIYRWWDSLGGEEAAMGYIAEVRESLLQLPDEKFLIQCSNVLTLAKDAFWIRLGKEIGELLFQVHGESSSPIWLKILGSLSVIYWDMGEDDKAENMMLAALKSQLLHGKHHVAVMSLHNDLGCLYRHSKQYMKSEKHLKLALKYRILKLGENHPETLRSMNDYGYLLQSTKQYKKADSFYKRALNGREKILGFKHPDTAVSLEIWQLFLWTWRS